MSARRAATLRYCPDRGSRGLRGHLERYVKAARKVTGSASRPAQTRKTPATDARNKEIRDWARDQGLYVSSRGRIPASIIAKYEAGNGM
jgi:Lsr2